jgi:pilus assembly protein Flp/PilA
LLLISDIITISLGCPEKFSKKGEKAMLFAPKEKGQGLVEYALILVLVAVVVIAVLYLLGPIVTNVFSRINSAMNK